MKKLLKKNVGANNHLPKTKPHLKPTGFVLPPALLLLIAFIMSACQKDQVDQDRIAELLLKGENVKSSDFKTAEKNLEDGDILHAVSDGKFHWTPKEYSAAEIAWLVKKLKELESTGKGVIKGKNYINPRDFTPEDSTYLANLGFQVYRYGDGDPCEYERDAVEAGVQDSLTYITNGREALEPALTVPYDITRLMFGYMNDHPDVPRGTFADTANYIKGPYGYAQVCETYESMGWPVPNPETMAVYFDFCNQYFQTCDELEAKRAALKECEDEHSGINFPQMKSGTVNGTQFHQKHNQEGILESRRRLQRVQT
ncbi:MAG: hypothetical protein FWH18_02910 [Marinilabiliaceae bacterium]|nr:hypothetical protein [Marinilabiliaceae bacterium]